MSEPRMPHYGKEDLGNIVCYGQYGKNNVRLLRCRTCRHRFSERHNTVFFGLHTDEKTAKKIFRSLAECNGIRATARIVGVDKMTVQRIFTKAGMHCERVLNQLMKDLHIEECQLDELWSFIKKQKHLSVLENLLSEYGDAWVWTSFDPRTKVIPKFVVGKRTLKYAKELVSKFRDVTDGTIPLFTSDKLSHYPRALLEIYGIEKSIERQPNVRGRPRKPELLIPEELQYAQVFKRKRKGGVVKVETKVIFGSERRIKQILRDSPVSRNINISFGERNGLTLRHQSKRLSRKTLCFSKQKMMLELALYLALAYYHFVRVHRGLRQRIYKQKPRKWRYRTPAMAAKITDHIWSTHELMS